MYDRHEASIPAAMSSLGVFWAARGKFWGDLGPFWGCLGAPWGGLEAVSRARGRGGS